MFTPVDSRANFPAEERKILEFWEQERIFQQSLDQRKDGPEFVFYDGPPFATGLPHYGHLLAGTIKDVIPRYQTMKGHYVDRVFGWDCHGLPVENEVEKSLNINSKHEIEEFGIHKFNESCRSIVLKYTSEWESVVTRMGRWVNFKDGYRTMDRDYMESIWWVFKQLWDKDLVYEGHKIMWYCPRCATPLSNFEVNQGYKTVRDPAVTVRFQVAPNRFILAWTTTPWTLPGNLALSVGPDIDYVEVADGDDRYILAEARLKAYYRKEQPEVVARFKGSELAGLTYQPLFPYFSELREEGAFRVISADFVTTGDGTGIVHTAPGFGEEDAEAAKANGVPAVCPIDLEGQYTPEVPDFVGRFVKDCDQDIILRLKAEGNLVHKTVYEHEYPHCWRCESPLLNKAIATWFVRVEQVKERMLAANKQIRWVPDHLQDGRFGKWLENARDWAISRNRFWGCPLPIWRDAETGETEVFGSVADLEARCGHSVDDIHKHFVDDIVLEGANSELRRVPEVLDCWFESGSMPYAQRHYPFSNKKWLDEHFPADFIAEGLDQTRGWFYTLVVLGAALFDKPAFKNVIVNGLILAEDGSKMSKRKKNYPDPMLIMDTYGADAMRLYMLSSAVVRGEAFRFSEKRHTITAEDGKQTQTPDGVLETMRAVLLPLWNSYSFFVTYANEDGWDPNSASSVFDKPPTNDLDLWILSRLDTMVAQVTDRLDNYDLQGASSSFTGLIEDLTNWYIRRSRRRFWKSDDDQDKSDAYATLHHVLITFCKTAAPQTPFITETIYRNLRADHMPESVHLCDWPEQSGRFRDLDLERRMAHIITAVSLGRFLRTQHSLKVRQPLAGCIVMSLDAQTRADLETGASIIAEELNIKSVTVDANESHFADLSAKANFRVLGRRLGKRMKAGADQIAAFATEQISELRNGGSVTIDLGDGDPVDITLDDIEIRRSEKEGLAVANEGEITVALDLQLSDDLIREGLAREVVSRIQGLRRDADLNVADRITVTYAAPAPIAEAIEAHSDYIANEVLALAISADAAATGDAIDISGHDCHIVVAKA